MKKTYIIASLLLCGTMTTSSEATSFDNRLKSPKFDKSSEEEMSCPESPPAHCITGTVTAHVQSEWLYPDRVLYNEQGSATPIVINYALHQFEDDRLWYVTPFGEPMPNPLFPPNAHTYGIAKGKVFVPGNVLWCMLWPATETNIEQISAQQGTAQDAGTEHNTRLEEQPNFKKKEQIVPNPQANAFCNFNTTSEHVKAKPNSKNEQKYSSSSTVFEPSKPLIPTIPVVTLIPCDGYNPGFGLTNCRVFGFEDLSESSSTLTPGLLKCGWQAPKNRTSATTEKKETRI